MCVGIQGDVSREVRQSLWREKRVFFCTPQVPPPQDTKQPPIALNAAYGGSWEGEGDGPKSLRGDDSPASNAPPDLPALNPVPLSRVLVEQVMTTDLARRYLQPER